MRIATLLAALFALGLTLAPGARAADDPLETLIEAHADSVVTVKYVLNLQVSMGGQTREMEQSGEATAVLVDAAGLAVLPDRVFNPSARGPRGRPLDIQATPSNVRVVFPGEAEEYDAIIGATDSKLGLAFVRIKDLAGREVRSVALESEAEVAIGNRLFGVSRLGQGFDYAPWSDSVQVVGRVTKPRKLWMLRGGFTELAHPLFTKEGACAGFVVVQEGVGGGNARPFLLPLKVAASTIGRAAKQAERVLEDVAAEEQTVVEEPEEAKETPEASDSGE